MNYLQQIEFVNPLWLVGLILLPLLVIYYYKRGKERESRLVISQMDGMTGIPDLRVLLAKSMPYFKILALGIMIVAMARPRSLLKEEKIQAEGIDIFMVMDLSLSMLSQDFEPDRITVARNVASEFVSGRKYDRFGLTVFGGESYTQSPLTTDLALIKQSLISLEAGSIGDGTAIGLGLASAVNRLKDSQAKSKVIILLTDGVNNVPTVDPITAAEIAKEFDISVYTIGIGTKGRAMSPRKRNFRGELIFQLSRVEIDEKLLKKIAAMTGGRYYRATDEEALKAVYKEIDQLEKTEIEVTTIKRYSEEYRSFLLGGLFLFLLVTFLQSTWLRVYP